MAAVSERERSSAAAAPPGGAQPPAEVMLDGLWIDVRALARELPRRADAVAARLRAAAASVRSTRSFLD